MDILFYRYDGIQNKVNKRLGESVTLQGNFDITSEVMNPIIRISRADDAEFSFVKYNYLCINSGSSATDFGNRPRYYFITDIKSIAKGVFLVYTKLDVLMTYKIEILNSKADIERSSSNYNLYLNDDFYQAYSYPRIGCMEFPNGFSDSYSYILNVCNTIGENIGG